MDDLRLFGYRCCFVEPLRQEGLVGEHGLFAADPYTAHSPFVLARILETHPSCRAVHVGDVVVTKPHSFETVWHNGKRYYVQHENNALAVVEGYDEECSEGRAGDFHAHVGELAREGEKRHEETESPEHGEGRAPENAPYDEGEKRA